MKGALLQTAVTGMEAVTAAFTTVTELVTTAWEMMTSNAYLTVFLAASLLGVGLAVLSEIKNAARH